MCEAFVTVAHIPTNGGSDVTVHRIKENDRQTTLFVFRFFL